MRSCKRSCGCTRASESTWGKTKVCDVLERIARIQHPSAVVWRGPTFPPLTKASGCSALHWDTQITWQQTLLDKIPSVSDVQSARLLSLHCQQPGARGASFGC